MATAVWERSIPNGLVFFRKARYGAYNNDHFFNFEWEGKPIGDEPVSYECPIYLFESETHYVGSGSTTTAIKYRIVASVFSDHLVDLRTLNMPSDYPIVDYFWKAHPGTLSTHNCRGKFRRHKEEPSDAHCFECDGELDFGSTLEQLLKEEVRWPIPTESILARDSSSTHVDQDSLECLQKHLKIVDSKLKRVATLFQMQDVATQSQAARIEVEALFVSKMSAIEKRASESFEICKQMSESGFDFDALKSRQRDFAERIEAIESGVALARLREEVALINAKISSLESASAKGAV